MYNTILFKHLAEFKYINIFGIADCKSKIIITNDNSRQRRKKIVKKARQSNF